MTRRTMFLWAIAVTVGLLAITVYVMLERSEPQAIVYGRDRVTEFYAITPEVCGGDKLQFNVTILSVNENSVISITRSWVAIDVEGLPPNLMLESLTTTATGVMRGDFQYDGPASRVVPEHVNARPGVWEYREAVENGATAMYYVQFVVPEHCLERSAN
jgi:hypothetical protein